MFMRHRHFVLLTLTSPRREGLMEMEEAVKIMRALANGQDPATGEALAESELCLRPENVKALNRALSALIQQEQWEKNRPLNAFRTWTRSEDMQVCDQLRRG